jgi:hypothetical protein
MLGGVILVVVRSRSMDEFDGIRAVLEKTTVGPVEPIVEPTMPGEGTPAMA